MRRRYVCAENIDGTSAEIAAWPRFYAKTKAAALTRVLMRGSMIARIKPAPKGHSQGCLCKPCRTHRLTVKQARS